MGPYGKSLGGWPIWPMSLPYVKSLIPKMDFCILDLGFGLDLDLSIILGLINISVSLCIIKFSYQTSDIVAVCDKRIFTLEVDKDLSLSSSANPELLFFKGPPA